MRSDMKHVLFLTGKRAEQTMMIYEYNFNNHKPKSSDK